MLRRSEGSFHVIDGHRTAGTSSKPNQQKMKKYQAEILQAVKMDGSIDFQTNGDINVYPCPWEDGKEVTDGSRVRYEAGVEVDADGRTRVKRWNRGSRGPMYKTLYETAHGAVMCTRGRTKSTRRPSEEKIVVKLVFPRRYGLALTKAMYQEETDEIMSYFKTRKEETIWK